MARGGSRGSQADWERQAAATQRQALAAQKAAERREREQARLAKEREKAREQQRTEEQVRDAEARSANVGEQVTVLDGVLPSALHQPAFTFDRLRVLPRESPFDPGSLGVAATAPQWGMYAPREPVGVDRWFGGVARHQRQLDAAQARFEADRAAYQRAEDDRLRSLEAAKRTHAARLADERAKVAARNAEVEARRAAFETGETDAVEWFVGKVLDASVYPEGFPRRYQVAYRPENRDVVVEFELPPQRVVPDVREYRYVKSKKTVEPVPRPQTEVKRRYAKLVASVALRTLHEIFTATPGEVVEAVVFNGRVDTIDRATGKRVRPHLISVEAERSAFSELVLAEVEPAACLKHLNALVSPNPFDLEAVEPFIAFDLKRFRFAEDMGTIADLDSRRNLLQLTPTEFEHLVKELFAAMGAEAWRTVPSKDGGVDAVATSKNLFFGGVCLIQAKRWTGLVGLDAVHALTGVMADHNATTGVLVTTSWFGRASEQFAQRNRITLINGAELKNLVKQYLGLDVIPGTNPPTRLRASDNTQTGRTGVTGP